MFDLRQNRSPNLIARSCVRWLLGLVFSLIATMAMAEVDSSPLVSRANLQTPLDYSYDGDSVLSPRGAISLDCRGINVRHCCDSARALYQHRLCREHSTTSSNVGDSLTRPQTACLSTITMSSLTPQRHQSTKPPIFTLFTIVGIALTACRSLVRHDYDVRPNKHDRHQRTGATFGVMRSRARCSDPGTGEFISRDRLEYLDGMSLYRGYFVPGAVDPMGLDVFPPDFIGPLQPGDQRLGLTWIEIKKDAKNCGGFSWQIEWMLTDKTKKGGWVIQKVEVSAEVKDCNGNLIDLKKHNIDLKNWPLWEAWEIKTGNAKENQGFPFSDNYEFPSFGTCTKGKITITGTAEFYVGLKLPVDFVPGGAKPAGDLPSTQKNPGKLPGGIGKVDHSLTATWNCCPKGKLEKTKLKLSKPPF